MDFSPTNSTESFRSASEELREASQPCCLVRSHPTLTAIESIDPRGGGRMATWCLTTATGSWAGSCVSLENEPPHSPVVFHSPGVFHWFGLSTMNRIDDGRGDEKESLAADRRVGVVGSGRERAGGNNTLPLRIVPLGPRRGSWRFGPCNAVNQSSMISDAGLPLSGKARTWVGRGDVGVLGVLGLLAVFTSGSGHASTEVLSSSGWRGCGAGCCATSGSSSLSALMRLVVVSAATAVDELSPWGSGFGMVNCVILDNMDSRPLVRALDS